MKTKEYICHLTDFVVAVEQGLGVKTIKSKDGSNQIIGFKTKDGRTIKPILYFEVESENAVVEENARVAYPRIEVTHCGHRELISISKNRSYSLQQS